MSYIKGKFKHIIFESESGYRVGLFKVNETDDENIPTNKLITYTGYFMKTNDNDNFMIDMVINLVLIIMKKLYQRVKML